ncbi:Heat stress transcription factor B-2b [Citrus sinensis]|nr:Heat stress transcription factor B-2b [Citrus sinensis]
MPELLEENEKLRKENAQLNNELSQLKGLCNNILALMTNYASGQLDNCARREEEEEQNQLQQQQGENEPGSDVKSEPLDANNDHHQEPPWLELGKS